MNDVNSDLDLINFILTIENELNEKLVYNELCEFITDTFKIEDNKNYVYNSLIKDISKSIMYLEKDLDEFLDSLECKNEEIVKLKQNSNARLLFLIKYLELENAMYQIQKSGTLHQVISGHVCFKCKSVNTPKWRKSNDYPGKYVCNMCGLREKKRLSIMARSLTPLFPASESG